jgi:hypothetical protein
MEESLFPFMDPQEVVAGETETELPLAKEWAWDFERCDFKTKNGKMYIVEGNEAIKIWIWKIFQTPRYRYLIYSWDYGNELEELIGKGSQSFIKSEAERLVKEAIWPTLNGYVEDIKNLEIDFKDDILIISFTAITPYGEARINV